MYDVTGLSLKSGILLSTAPIVLKEVADLQIPKAGAVLMTAEELQVGSYDMNGGQYEAHFDFQNPEHMLFCNVNNYIFQKCKKPKSWTNDFPNC